MRRFSWKRGQATGGEVLVTTSNIARVAAEHELTSRQTVDVRLTILERVRAIGAAHSRRAR